LTRARNADGGARISLQFFAFCLRGLNHAPAIVIGG